MSGRVWHNFNSDYKPLTEFAMKNKIHVIAANAPRRYVNLVSREGKKKLNKLSKEALKWLAPLPYAEASKKYRDKIDTLNREIKKQFQAIHKNKGSKKSAMHKTIKKKAFVGVQYDAQSLWDSTMAFSIVEALKKDRNSIVININGRFHSDENLGIPEHIRHYNTDLKILIISIHEEKDFPVVNQDFSLGVVGCNLPAGWL